jgi:hypothetical protein
MAALQQKIINKHGFSTVLVQKKLEVCTIIKADKQASQSLLS